jgi:ABC-2 type transport system ATP-binding protein
MTSGSAGVLGFDVAAQATEIRKRIGVVQQRESYESTLAVEEAMDMYGFLWGVPKSERRRRIPPLLERFGLQEVRKTKAPELSIGQRRRLQVAREFMHDMDLLFLDEPTIGLDPLVRRRTLEFFKDRVKDGLTIFFTTHILDVAEYLCDRVAFFYKGRIIATGSPLEIKRRFGKSKVVELRVSEGTLESLMSRIKNLDSVEKILSNPNDGSMRIITSEPVELTPKLIRMVEELGLHLSSISVVEPSLEEAYLNLITDGQT